MMQQFPIPVGKSLLLCRRSTIDCLRLWFLLFRYLFAHLELEVCSFLISFNIDKHNIILQVCSLKRFLNSIRRRLNCFMMGHARFAAWPLPRNAELCTLEVPYLKFKTFFRFYSILTYLLILHIFHASFLFSSSSNLYALLAAHFHIAWTESVVKEHRAALKTIGAYGAAWARRGAKCALAVIY